MKYLYTYNLISEGSAGIYLKDILKDCLKGNWIPVVIPFDFAWAERN